MHAQCDCMVSPLVVKICSTGAEVARVLKIQQHNGLNASSAKDEGKDCG